MLYDLCAKHEIPHRNTKKWIVAQDEQQWEASLRVHEHAKAIGVPTRLVGREEARRREPEVRATAGIVESPTTGIVDSHSYMMWLQAAFEDKGGDCAFRTEVTRIEPINGGKEGYRIFTRSPDKDGEGDGGGVERMEETSITAEVLINSAGNSACNINNMVLPPSRHRTPYYAKGTYFSYSVAKPRPSTLIYPAPIAGLGGLGTHLTLDLSGRVRFGPDVEWVTDPTDFRPSSARLDAAISEIRSYLPSIDISAIDLAYCGIRPKLSPTGSVSSGKGFNDFIIREEDGFPGFVNLLGIESPGLTSSLAISEMVDRILYG